MKAYWIYLLALLLCLTGCGQRVSPETAAPITQPVTQPITEPVTEPTEMPTAPPTEPEPTEPPTSPVIDFLLQLYEPDGTVTPTNYNRLSYLPIEGLNDLITWSVEAEENLVRVVNNEDGSVTIDINELCPEDTAYRVTASVVNADGIRVSHTWQYVIPQARDMAAVLDEAYSLRLRQQLSYYATLTGQVTSIIKEWSEDYQDVTLIMSVPSAGNRQVRCYGLVGEGTELLQVGDTITVTGILKKYATIVEFDIGCTLHTFPLAEE